MFKRLLLALAVTALGALVSVADEIDRYRVLFGAKSLVITTTSGSTYYYIVSSTNAPVMKHADGQVIVGRDTFPTAEVKSVRLKNMTRFILDEDSAAFAGDYSVDHGLLGLRRSLVVGKWNSVVLPVSLTGWQVRDTFGQDAALACVRGISEADQATVEFQLVSLDTDDVVMEANMHYIIRPSREPDIAAGKKLTFLSNSRLEGPAYFIPQVSMATKQTPQMQRIVSDDRSTIVMQRGTYSVRDGSSAKNSKVMTAGHSTYVFGDDGLISGHADSVAVKAFTSWFSELSQQPVSLRFYIDGISEYLTQISSLTSQDANLTDDRIFDLQGRLVGRQRDRDHLPKGIYIINGRKFMIQ